MGEREAFIALNTIEGMGPVKARALVQSFGNIEQVFRQDVSSLQSVKGIGKVLAERLAGTDAAAAAEGELDAARRAGAKVLTPVDEGYPGSLRPLHSPPLALYIKGTYTAQDTCALGMVGSRQCTHYGKSNAHRFAYQCARAGMTVISGLARGIDEAAHRGALDAGGRTLAVLGSGMNELYPRENRMLADEIAANGAVISEYPMNRKPDRTTFPYRNRIISGLSLGILMVEAGLRSGAMHTADAAAEQGRTVFALPGRIDSPGAQGCHHLIKDGAVLVTGLQDILEELGGLLPAPQPDRACNDAAGAQKTVSLSPEEKKIMEALKEGDCCIDDVCRSTGLDMSRLGAVLLGLELRRLVKMLPGKRVESLLHQHA